MIEIRRVEMEENKYNPELVSDFSIAVYGKMIFS